MSQAASWGVSESGPQTPTAHAVENNDSLNAILSQHLGASRPAYAVESTIWNKDLTGGSPPTIETYLFDGTDDILICTFNVTANTIEFSGLVIGTDVLSPTGDGSGLSGIIAEAASQAEQKTASAIDKAVTPGRQQYHPSAPKCWGQITGGASPVISSSYNVTSITDTGVGDLLVTIATDFSSANYSVNGQPTTDTGQTIITRSGKAAGSFSLNAISFGGPAAAEWGVGADFVVMGDQA